MDPDGWPISPSDRYMASFSGAQAAFHATRILGRWEKAPNRPGRIDPGPSLENERREVFESVLQAMATMNPDPDRTAACRYLLRHLARG